MNAIGTIIRLILNVFDHPVYGPIARNVAREATAALLRRAATGKSSKSRGTVG